MSTYSRRSSQFSADNFQKELDSMIQQRVSRPQPQQQQRITQKNKFKPFPKNKLKSPEIKNFINKNFQQYDEGKQSLEQMNYNLQEKGALNIDTQQIDKFVKENNHLDYKNLIKNINEPTKDKHRQQTLSNSEYFSKPEISKDIGKSQSIFHYRRDLEQMYGLQQQQENEQKQQVNFDYLNSQEQIKSMMQGSIKKNQLLDELNKIPNQDYKNVVKQVSNVFQSQYSQSYTLQHSLQPVQRYYRNQNQEKSLTGIEFKPNSASSKNLMAQVQGFQNDNLNKRSQNQDQVSQASSKQLQQNSLDIYHRKYLGEIRDLTFDPKRTMDKQEINDIRNLQIKKCVSNSFLSGNFDRFSHDSQVQRYHGKSPQVSKNLLTSPDNTIQCGI